MNPAFTVLASLVEEAVKLLEANKVKGLKKLQISDPIRRKLRCNNLKI